MANADYVDSLMRQ